MKRYIFPFMMVASIVALTTSCETNEIEVPDFSVSTEKLTYKVGDTVKFDFSGNPDVLTFYSGELGKNYDAKERFIASGINRLSFQSAMQQGAIPPAANDDRLTLMISTDLAGYDATSINNATWTDITARNTKWPTTLTETFTTSDPIDISDFNTAEKINIAFKYVGKPNPTFAQRRWRIQNLTLNNTLPDGTVTPLFSTFANTGWVQASIKNDLLKGSLAITNPDGTITPARLSTVNAWNVGTANVSARNNPIVITVSGALKAVNTNFIEIRTAYPITFDPGTVVNNDENEDWLITSAVNLKRTKADVGTVIKSTINKTLKRYQYIYRTPGTYTVSFDAMNNDLNDSKRLVKKLEITVTP